MSKSIEQNTSKVIRDLFSFKKSNRDKHIPILAALCVGTPLLTGLVVGHLTYGLGASMAGLVILYIPGSSNLAGRMKKLLLTSLGFIISYAIGLVFAFDATISCIVFGIFTVLVHWLNLNLQTKPPGSFFFIMFASIASCMPYDPASIPLKISLIAVGTASACTLAFIYSLIIKNKKKSTEQAPAIETNKKNQYDFFLEAVIFGAFMFISLLSGHLLKLQNPYWIPISCLAVMQGVSLHHIWLRVIHRILGTFIGMGFCWIILSLLNTPLPICIAIIVLQLIVELLLTRNYALAVAFITPMTLLMAEAANPLIQDPNHLISIRFLDISIGSILGAVGGWFLYNEKLRHYSTENMRKAKQAFKRR